MKKYKIAVLDDYQNVALESADWSVLRDRADIAVFQDHLADPDAVIERLLPFDVVCVMRERTPLPRNVIERLPNLKLIASTLRTATTASRNAWGAIALYQDQIVHVSQIDIDILDRVGGGDSFASGLIYGLLVGKPIEWAVRCGVAHGALAMTTAGDTSMASLAEVERAMKGGSARIAR